MIYSQRDFKWINEQIGNTPSTIGNYGCTITCIGMLAGITPSEVNKRLTDVGGYLNDLVRWTKIEEAIPWLEFEWRGYSYDNTKVKEAIEKNGGCLVEVDFDGATATPGDRHWVLFTGDGKMQDPWTGTIEPTSKYKILKGYSIINVKENMPTDLEVCLSQHEQLVKEAGEKDQEISDLEIACDSLKERVIQLEKEIKDHVCPIVVPSEAEVEYVINGMTKTYEKDGFTITENYAVK